MPFVIDTSILISAALSPHGKPRRVVEHVLRHDRIIFCEQTAWELSSRLLREKFSKWQSIENREQFISNTMKFAKFTSITGTLRACRDANDDMFLETALLGRADAIITGDKDLLVLHPFKDIPILTAADFLEQFER